MIDPIIHSSIELEEVMGVGKSVTARWIAYYGFPKPKVSTLEGRLKNQWDRAEVIKWMAENKEILEKSQILRRRQKGF